MNEQIKKFDALYAKMAESSDIKDMELFGKVMREAMMLLSERMPDKVDEYLEELCAINWNNYLTKKEAERIVSEMQPSPKWSMEQIKRTLDAKGLLKEEMPYYNECALVTTISMIASNSLKTIEKYAFGGSAGDDQMMDIIYHLALDELKDEDKVFDIRKYFNKYI